MISRRPLKYRAWTGKEMVVVQTLCFNEGGVIWYGPVPHMGYSQVFDSTMWNDNNPKPSTKELKPVMAWTGLYDKNGKEIYEGDIVTTGKTYPHWWVSWNEKTGSWNVGGYNLNTNQDFSVNTVFLTVIGNIYETPELLRQS